MGKHLLLLACFILTSACSFTQTEGPTQSQANNSKGTVSQNRLIRDFEQKIAAKLLADQPTWQTIATLENRQTFLNASESILFGSGLNRNFLTPPQRQTLRQLEKHKQSADFEIQHWTELNHLASVIHLNSVTSESADDQESLPNRIGENLTAQIKANKTYPASFIAFAADAVRETHPNLANLAERLSQDSQSWARRRLLLAFPDRTEEDYGALIASLEQRLVSETLADVSAYYRDPYYDIRQEQDPEQLALDLIVLHLEEALTPFQQTALSIKGTTSAAAKLYEVTPTSVTVNLEQLLSLPAFEYMSISYDIAAEVILTQHWSTPTRAYLKSGLSHWLQDQTAARSETTIGRQTRARTRLLLALTELRLALGETNIQDIERELSLALPYQESQIKTMLTNWYLQEASIVPSVIVDESITSFEQSDIFEILAAPTPMDFSALESLLAQQLAQ